MIAREIRTLYIAFLIVLALASIVMISVVARIDAQNSSDWRLQADVMEVGALPDSIFE